MLMNRDQGVEPVTMCLVCLRPALQHGCWFNCYPVLADWMNTVYYGALGLSKSPACYCGADSKSHHHGMPPVRTPIPSTKWSPWLEWCWCRCSNSWVATKQFSRDLTISFGYYKVSHARRRRTHNNNNTLGRLKMKLVLTKMSQWLDWRIGYFWHADHVNQCNKVAIDMLAKFSVLLVKKTKQNKTKTKQKTQFKIQNSVQVWSQSNPILLKETIDI